VAEHHPRWTTLPLKILERLPFEKTGATTLYGKQQQKHLQVITSAS